MPAQSARRLSPAAATQSTTAVVVSTCRHRRPRVRACRRAERTPITVVAGLACPDPGCSAGRRHRRSPQPLATELVDQGGSAVRDRPAQLSRSRAPGRCSSPRWPTPVLAHSWPTCGRRRIRCRAASCVPTFGSWCRGSSSSTPAGTGHQRRRSPTDQCGAPKTAVRSPRSRPLHVPGDRRRSPRHLTARKRPLPGRRAPHPPSSAR